MSDRASDLHFDQRIIRDPKMEENRPQPCFCSILFREI
jgi:hypothetical protein